MNLLHLTMALLIDLGLNKPPTGPPPTSWVFDPPSILHGKAVNDGLRTSDQRRALLGCYYLTAKASVCFKRLEAMRYNQHLDDCCQALNKAAEYPTDTLLVQLVQIHRVVEKYLPTVGARNYGSVPIKSFFGCLDEDIHRFTAAIPASLTNNGKNSLSCSSLVNSSYPLHTQA
jgi:hypothetical protein